MIDFYKNQKTFGLEKYFVMIEDWLKKDIETQEENLPLVIEASEGVGKKTLLIQWIQHHIKNSKQVSTAQTTSKKFLWKSQILKKKNQIFFLKF